MNDSHERPASSDQFEREAAAWVLRCDRGLTPSEQDDLSSWLAAHPHNSPQFARYRHQWKRLDKLGQWRPEHSARPNPDLLAPRPKFRVSRMVAVSMSLAVAAGIAMGLVIWESKNAVTATISAAPVNAHRLLEDGSVVEMNRDAVMSVSFTANERRVRLERGEAFFTISKNPARPFIVTAGELDVRAIGTAFSVRMSDATLRVLVTEGHVQLASRRAELLRSPSSPQGGSIADVAPVLKTNQQAVVSLLPQPVPLQIATLTPGEIGAELAWQHRLLDFNAVPLAEVVAEFNRRNRVQLIVADAELASIPISASFRSDNIEGFLRLLEAGFAASAERRGEFEIHLRRGR